MIIKDVEAEAGGAFGVEAFLESLEVEASKIRLRLRLQEVFESFIFYHEKYLKYHDFNFLKVSTFTLIDFSCFRMQFHSNQ